jgi:hypothetical protein
MCKREGSVALCSVGASLRLYQGADSSRHRRKEDWCAEGVCGDALTRRLRHLVWHLGSRIRQSRLLAGGPILVGYAISSGTLTALTYLQPLGQRLFSKSFGSGNWSWLCVSRIREGGFGNPLNSVLVTVV